MFCLSFISSLAKAKLSFPCVGAPIIFIGHISEVICFNIISSAIRQQASTMDWCIAAFLLFSPMLFWRCLHCVRCHSTTAQEDWTRRIQIRCSLGGNVTMFWPVRDMAVIKIYFVPQFFLVTTPPVAVAFWLELHWERFRGRGRGGCTLHVYKIKVARRAKIQRFHSPKPLNTAVRLVHNLPKPFYVDTSLFYK